MPAREGAPAEGRPHPGQRSERSPHSTASTIHVIASAMGVKTPVNSQCLVRLRLIHLKVSRAQTWRWLFSHVGTSAPTARLTTTAPSWRR